jgi:YVTN family beta-propeller protein
VIEANCLANTVGVISRFNNSVTAITVGSRPVALAVNPVTGKIYVANSASNSVSVIDGNTFATATVSVGANPRSVAVNEITNRIYVANNADNTVTIIDGVTNNTATVSAGANPIAIAINPVTNQIYVANLGDTVTIIDGATEQTTTVPVGVFPQSLAVNPVTNQIYVANTDSDTVTVINGATQQTTTLNVGLFPVAIAINPVSNQIYVADNHSLDVTVVDGLTGSITTVALADNPTALAVDISSNQIYVATAGGGVTVIDGATNQRTATVPVGANPLAVAINPVTNRVYTADSNSGTVTAIDAATNQTMTVGLGGSPLAVGANPVTNLIYVSNANDNTVSVIDGASNQTSTISVGTKPTALAVNPASNQIYIVNSVSNTATVIDGLTNEVTTVNVGVNPTAVTVNPVTNWAYVANSGGRTVTAINGATLQTMSISVGAAPSAIAVNPATDIIYVANSADNTVTVINGVTGQEASVNVGVKPFAIATNSVTNKIYVANSGDSSVTVIDGATNQTTNVAVGRTPVAVAVNPVTNRIYVANSGSGTVTVIVGSTNRVTTVTVGSKPDALAANPVSDHIYVANAGSNTVTVIDGASNQTTTEAAGANPAALSINPITSQIYVANSASDNLSVIAEQRIGALPLATVISSLPSNQTAARSPTIVLSANSSYSPFNPTVQGIRYQVDSWEGLWPAAKAVDTSFNANPSQLQLGPHVIYAFADNGLAAATAGLNQNTVGSIAGYFFTVVQGQTTTEVTSSLNPSSDAQSVTLTALVQPVAPATGMPTGTVSFLDNSSILASGLGLDGTGQASFRTSSLTPGTHSITASYTGDANFVNSVSTPLNQVVAKGQTVATLGSSTNSSVFGQAVTLTVTVQPVAPATGTPTGAVSILDGSTIVASGVALNASGQASFGTSSLSPGTHSLTANYSGDVNFASSVSTSINQVVAKGQTIATLASTLNSSAFGQGLILTVTVQAAAPAAGIPTGTMTIFDGTTILAGGLVLNGSGHATFTTSSLAPGTHSITASYIGDVNFASSASASISQVVAKGQALATLASSVNSSAIGQVVTLTVTVQAVAPATGIPTGTVSILDGTTILASGVALNASGQGSFGTSSLAWGTHSITASYAGDGNFASSVSTSISQIVAKGQAAATLASSVNSSAFGQAVTLTVVVQPVSPGTPTGTVTILDGTTILAGGLGLNGSGQASFNISSLAPGTHSLTANYTGDVNFASSVSTSISQVVTKGQTIAILGSSLNSSAFGQGVTLTVTVQAVAPAAGIPTGAVTILDGSTILVSGVLLDANGHASFTTPSLAMGANSLAASYAGDADFASSSSGGVNDTVNSAQMALTLSQTSLSVPAGGGGSFNLNISSNGTLLSPITFGCAGLPANTTCLFSPSSLSPSALPGKVTVQITTDNVASVLKPRDGIGGIWYGLSVMGIVFAGMERRSRRSKSSLGIATALLLVAACLGCGSGTGKTLLTNSGAATPPGVSLVSVTASSGSSQATVNVTLTVEE